jgi:hypothetical protein
VLLTAKHMATSAVQRTGFMSTMGKSWLRAAAAPLCAVLLQVGPCTLTASADGIRTGVLTCRVASGFGWIFGSSRTMECKFEPSHGYTENYTGTVSTIGLDVGYLRSSVIVWAVVASGSSQPSGALAGTYVGASAQVATVMGAGVSVMTGGSRNSITLQPLSVTGDTGLYVGGGISSMTLEPADY